MQVAILGCGFTGTRVARRMLDRGATVLATSRSPKKLAGLGVEVVDLESLPKRLAPGALVLHSIPPEGPADVLKLLGDMPARVVYLSSTAVYGAAEFVDETTAVDPASDRARARLVTEAGIAGGPWSSLILRPAAIYGPGRGIHERVRRGQREFSGHVVSRIHVEDLAALCEAALLCELTGAYPVADEEPASSLEVARFAAELLGLPEPVESSAVTSPRGNGSRRADGSGVRRALGVELRYPTYRDGVRAALEAVA